MKIALEALWASIVRTIVPVSVGAIMSWLTTRGLPLDDQLESALTAALTAAFALIWYVIVRLLETYVAPRFGWLLGLAKSPDSYSKDSPVEEAGGKHVAE